MNWGRCACLALCCLSLTTVLTLRGALHFQALSLSALTSDAQLAPASCVFGCRGLGNEYIVIQSFPLQLIVFKHVLTYAYWPGWLACKLGRDPSLMQIAHRLILFGWMLWHASVTQVTGEPRTRMARCVSVHQFCDFRDGFLLGHFQTAQHMLDVVQ